MFCTQWLPVGQLSFVGRQGTQVPLFTSQRGTGATQ